MDRRNRLGLYGAYFCGMAGIGFTLPYLPLYLRGEGFSDRAISFVSALAAAWVTDRLGGPRKAGEAQVLVGSALVFGSAVGPAATGLVVDALGYRGTFAALAGVGAVATLLVVVMVPETLEVRPTASDIE
jgi:MFS family permease